MSGSTPVEDSNQNPGIREGSPPQGPATPESGRGKGLASLVYFLVAVLAGLLCWWLVDWNVYFQTGGNEYEPRFKLSVAEQLAGSAVMGVSLAALLFARAW